MSRSVLIWRYVIAGIALLLFTFGAYYLYQRQQLKINYLSFELENPKSSFIVPDIDRLVEKMNSPDDLSIDSIHPDLYDAISAAILHKHFSINRELAGECFISSSENDFVIVFKTTASLDALLETLSAEFGVEATSIRDGITLAGKTYYAGHFGYYLAISTKEIHPSDRADVLKYGNADYVVFNGIDQPVRHIISDKYHFRVWKDSSENVKGKAIDHNGYFKVVPADFDEIVFYGSSRITEDVQTYFKSASAESFAWLSNGVMYIRQGDMELLMAEQGDQRDLSLMLEEQTLKHQGDTADISYFNIGNFKIMPFVVDFKWNESIPELKEDLRFYTEYNNFNLLSNNIPAMRWFLGQVQLGNLIQNNAQIFGTYTDCLPEKAHFVSMGKNENGGFACQSRIYDADGSCLYSDVTSGLSQIQMKGVEIVHDFPVQIVPDKLQAVKDNNKECILLNNAKQLALYSVSGEKLWSLDLTTPLVEDPQIADFENDGHFEVVLFQSNQVDVVNSKGKSLSGYPVLYGGSSSAGLAVNYDNEYKWRLLINVNNTVRVYSEEGQVVEGWMFKGMNAPLKGKIYHVITDGKDIITFKDRNNVQHVLNRRGEQRLDQEVRFALPDETDFVVGSLEAALRKMGYSKGFIYNYYILDGQRDSVAIDQTIAPIRTFWEYNEGKPLLIVEEPDRLLIVNQFGYVQSEVLKPNQSNQFIGLVGKKDYGFVFADNSQNSIYLLNNFGKMILPQAVEGSEVSIIEGNLLYTFSGISVKAYKIAE